MVFSIFRLVADNHLTGARVDPCLHRLLERRPSLDEVVLKQPKFGFLRELAGILVKRTIAKAKYQVTRNDVVVGGFGAFPFREFVVVKAAQRKKAVSDAFLLVHRHLVSSPGWYRQCCEDHQVTTKGTSSPVTFAQRAGDHDR